MVYCKLNLPYEGALNSIFFVPRYSQWACCAIYRNITQHKLRRFVRGGLSLPSGEMPKAERVYALPKFFYKFDLFSRYREERVFCLNYIMQPKQFRRHLRKESTGAEKILWFNFRNRKFLNLKIRRQHPIENFIADFYCDELKLIIEVDGSIHDNQPRKIMTTFGINC